MNLNKVYIFEFTGVPKSGKTSAMEIVTHYLKRSGYKVKQFHGGGRYSPIDKGKGKYLNMWIINQIISSILEYTEGENSFPHIFLMDRGLFDRCAFTKAILKREEISSDEYNTMISYLTLPTIVHKVDAIFLFITSVKHSIERELKHKILEKHGRVMNTKYLNLLRESYLETYDENKCKFKKVFILDTEKLNNEQTETAQYIVDIIEKTISR